MFKYIKTIHSHTVAETCRFPVSLQTTIPKGTLCQFVAGKLENSNGTKPRYLVLEDKTETDGKKYVDCIRILPGMMLVGTPDFDTTTAKIGDLCSFATDMNERCTMITSGGTAAEIVDISDGLLTIIIN